jgi:hypothetical protein
VLGATAPNIGARSSDCGSTCHPLMKAQRNVAEDFGKKGAVPASISATDCLRISVTFKPPSKNAGSRTRLPRRMLTTAFAETALSQGELGFLDL